MSVDTIRSAYEALGAGDVEPLVALMSPELEWRGIGPGWRFWRPTPSGHGPDEAREVLESALGWNRVHGDHDFRIDAIDQVGPRIAVAFSWTKRGGSRRDFGQVLKLRHGRIAEMRDYGSGAEARGAL